MIEPHYSPDDLAAALPGQSRRTIIEAVRREGWPHVRVGRRISFTQAQVDQIIAQHTIGAGQESRAELVATTRSGRRSA